MPRDRAAVVCSRGQTGPAGAFYDLQSIETTPDKELLMLYTLVVVLLVLWLLGVATSFTLGGLIHILLVVAVIVVLLRVIQGRNPLRG